MWIATGFHAGDINLARALFQWCHQLDSRLSHGALLVCDPAVDWSDASDVLNLAAQVFQRVELISSDVTVDSWLAGANALFQTAAQFFNERKIGPWFWMEPDAVPLKKGWLDTLEAAYSSAGKPFMGTVMQAEEPHLAGKYLAGCAVYPMNAWTLMAPGWDDCRAFDVATALVTVPLAAHTPLIQHFWGQKDLPPTFVAERTAESPKNAFTLDKIRPEAVLFHRNKDGTLLKLLGYRGSKPEISLDVVLSVCAKDAKLLLKNLMWMGVLHGKKNASAVLLVDRAVVSSMRSQLACSALSVFQNVTVHDYSSSILGWPAGPNRAFQEACRVMSGGNRAWFWHEPDVVAVVPDWLEQLSFEYTRAGKPFMGTIIGQADHLNGVAVYPQNVERYAPALGHISGPWDVELQHYITPHRHRANHLIQHHRGPPSFASMSDLKEVEPGVVVFHPDKSGKLMDRLAEKLLR